MDSSPVAHLVPTFAPEMAWVFENVREAGSEVHLTARGNFRFLPVFEVIRCWSRDNLPYRDSAGVNRPWRKEKTFTLAAA